MNEEQITVTAGGKVWTAFTRVTVNASVSEAARSFELQAAFEPGAAETAAAFGAGSEVQIKANGDLLCKAFVDRYQPRIGASLAQVHISGRSKAQDAIDGAAVHKTGRFENKTIIDIAGELDKAKVGFSADVALKTIPKVQLRPGETVFQVVERLAREQHKWVAGQADGTVKIGDASAPKRHAGALVEGLNIKTGSADHDWSQRHSHYVVRGQKAAGVLADVMDIEAIAKDAKVERFRPLVVVVEEDIDADRAKSRAKAHRDRHAGASLKASIGVQGFRDDSGTVWEPGRIIPVDSPTLYVSQDMLIESVEFTQDDSGSIANLSLVDPRAHNGKAGRGDKSSKAWDQDDDDADETPSGSDSPIAGDVPATA